MSVSLQWHPSVCKSSELVHDALGGQSFSHQTLIQPVAHAFPELPVEAQLRHCNMNLATSASTPAEKATHIIVSVHEGAHVDVAN